MSTVINEMPTPTNTRRAFLKRAGAAAAAATFVAVAGLDSDALAQVGSGVQAFRIDHAEDIRVRITSGSRFDVLVTGADGSVLEEYRSISLARFMRVRSSHFEVTAINPGE